MNNTYKDKYCQDELLGRNRFLEHVGSEIGEQDSHWDVKQDQQYQRTYSPGAA